MYMYSMALDFFTITEFNFSYFCQPYSSKIELFTHYSCISIFTANVGHEINFTIPNLIPKINIEPYEPSQKPYRTLNVTIFT